VYIISEKGKHVQTARPIHSQEYLLRQVPHKKCTILSFSIPIFPTFSGKSFSAVLVSWHRGQVVLSQVLGLEKHLEEINVSIFDSEDLPETFPKVATSL
jgi:hypothetical protein